MFDNLGTAAKIQTQTKQNKTSYTKTEMTNFENPDISPHNTVMCILCEMH